ncbi:endolytic transglycosylase MltG [Candidatus Microgenomates bacterium]|nr:MAG: endolytic transglycosylase MltG [Candidatus Microgenomates bacterium]
MTKKPRNTAGLFLRKFKKITDSSYKVKKIPFNLSVLFFLLLFVFIGGKVWWKESLKPFDPSKQTKISFVIRKGEPISLVASRLKEEGLIKSPVFFKVYLMIQGLSKKIQAGTYQLSASMTPMEISGLFIKGTNDQWVTIIEGLRQEQIGAQLIKSGFAVNPKDWQEKVISEGLEGRIFPDSYLFPKDAKEETILKIIASNFEKKVISGLKEEIAESKLSFEDALILASIVEREARTETDRKIVAGILLKRLQNNWPLQVDASVQYAVASQRCRNSYDPNCDWWPKSLSKNDLKISSPFNSYLNQGLPPGPICNPGLSSIKAALSPKESSYWFYISDLEGKMHYAKTSEEHAQNIGRYLLR